MMFWRIVWRYFTGLHLDGKHRQTGRNGSVLPKYSNYFWNRYTRRRRAIWRNAAFWLLLFCGYGLLADQEITLYALLVVSPFAAFQVCRKLVNMLTQVVSYSDSDGVTEPYRIVRPQVRRWIGSHRPRRFRVNLPDGGPVPVEIQRAILADNMEDHGEPIINLRQLQLMQGEDVTDLKDGRSRTIARKHRKVRK